MNFRSRRSWLLIGTGLIIFLFVATLIEVLLLNGQIAARLQKGWFLPPIEFYSAPRKIRLNENLDPLELKQTLISQGWRERLPVQTLFDRDFMVLPDSDCLNLVGQEVATVCIKIWRQNDGPGIIAWNVTHQIVGLWSGPDHIPVSEISFNPELFAQYYQGQPILRRLTQIGNTPLECLQAVTAIEDSDFLKHGGISLSAIGRAMLRNLQKARFAEGGSTITQQLVKNYFLTGEKKISRKIKEQLMAILIESRYSKDDILTNYLNVIYMGQNGPFQIRGFGSAAQFYFQKDLETLNLSECALLAAIINNPGRYNPVRNPDNAKARRSLVLDRMVALEMIAPEQKDDAETLPLPKGQRRSLSEPAPYFVQAVLRKIEELGIDTEEGLKVYTTLSPKLQELAQVILAKATDEIESRFSNLIELKKAGKSIQSALLVVDVSTGGVAGLVGGRSYKNSQYNRVLSAHRQPGSLFKPVVYLAALELSGVGDKTYTPLTVLQDEPWMYTYEGQTWEPQNYDRKFRGPIPLFFALTNSINIPTAHLATEVRLNNIIDLAHRLGISSVLDQLPSLSLGAFEVTPWEIGQAYSTLARFGEYIPLHLIRRIESPQGQLLFQEELEAAPVIASAPTASLVSMLEKTFSIGTAQSARAWGWNETAAGKTGTTSDTKDAWFAGFTPDLLAVTWVGFDDNTPTELTGASGALPIWSQFMKEAQKIIAPRPFQWPDTTTRKVLDHDDLEKIWPQSPESAGRIPESLEFIFDSQHSPFDD